MTPPRFILYSQDDPAGADHLHRSLAIAAAVTEAAPDASVLLMTGETEPIGDALPAHVDVLRLPGLRGLAGGRYTARRLAVSQAELQALRRTQIEAAVKAFRPDAMLVDAHPLAEEARAAIRILHAAGGRAVLGFRDVLCDPAAVLDEWSALGLGDLGNGFVERLVVYGDRRLVEVEERYGLPERLATHACYVGYVVPPSGARGTAAPPPELASKLPRRPVVLAAANGHEDGAHLLAAFVEAARGAPWDGVVAVGRGLSEADRHALRRDAVAAGVAFHVEPSDLSRWFAHADALVCTGGYSTIAQAIACGTPTLCVPSGSGDEVIRARALGRLGVIQPVEPWSVDAALLRTTVPELLTRGAERPTGSWAPRLDGASRTAKKLLELAAG